MQAADGRINDKSHKHPMTTEFRSPKHEAPGVLGKRDAGGDSFDFREFGFHWEICHSEPQARGCVQCRLKDRKGIER